MAGGKGKIKPSDNPKPYTKGNGGGYPKGLPNAKTRLKRLLSIMLEKKNPLSGETESMSIADQMDISQIIKALKGDTVAYREVMDRYEGKVKQDIGIEEKITKIKVGFTKGAGDSI